MRRVVYSLVIINKAGGLVYNRDFNNALNKISVNDLLVLAGTFHGYGPFHAILPTHSSIEADRPQVSTRSPNLSRLPPLAFHPTSEQALKSSSLPISA